MDETSAAAETTAPEETATADLEAVLEAILFVTSEPVPRDQLLAVFEPAERAAAERALAAVLARYAPGEAARGIVLDEVSGGVRLVTRPELHGYLRKFFAVAGSNKLSMPALETLAIIAYRQPITGPEIGELRSVQSTGVLKTLLERRLVRIAGRKPVVGKPFLYCTTREFLMHFGLGTLQDLPPLEEFEERLAAEVPGGGEPVAAAGEDREEEILRQAAALAEADDEAPSRPAEPAEPAEAAEASDD